MIAYSFLYVFILRKYVFTGEVFDEAIWVHCVCPVLDSLFAWHACEELVVVVY